LHLVGILFPHIKDDARSKSHQIYNILVYFATLFVYFGKYFNIFRSCMSDVLIDNSCKFKV